MQQWHSCLAQYSIKKIVSNLHFIHTSITTLTAKPEVVDDVINPLFQRFRSSDVSSLLQKSKTKQNKTKIQANLAQIYKVGWSTYSEQRQLETFVSFGKLDHTCNM